jgi:1-acyl-sn-glycerol-3-phosphate acyltransferase
MAGVPLPIRRIVDVLVTSAAWLYFIIGFFVFFLPGLLAGLLAGGGFRAAVQRTYHWFFRGFFALVVALGPGLRRRIDPAVRGIRGAVVISNHVSYLDPLLMVALFPRQTTFVKRGFFRVPLFGWCLRAVGYLPAGSDDGLDPAALRRIEALGEHLRAGGIVFLFPEGHRGPPGSIGSFRKGAFRLARRFGVPVELLLIRNTDALFTPGRFLFRTCVPNTIEVERIGSLRFAGDAGDDGPALSSRIEEAQQAYRARLPGPARFP